MPGIQLIINLSTISNHKKKVLINASDQDYQTIFHFGMVHKLKVEWTGLNLWSPIGDSFPRILVGGPLQPASLVVVRYATLILSCNWTCQPPSIGRYFSRL